MTIITSDHKSEIQFLRNHIPLIRRNKWFNSPAQGEGTNYTWFGCGKVYTYVYEIGDIGQQGFINNNELADGSTRELEM